MILKKNLIFRTVPNNSMENIVLCKNENKSDVLLKNCLVYSLMQNLTYEEHISYIKNIT